MRDWWLKMAVNALTGIGGGLGLIAVPVAFAGNIRHAWMLLGVAMIIDWSDGLLVRSLGLQNVGGYDGERLDEYADLVTYVLSPALVAMASGQLPRTAVGYSAVVFICVTSFFQFTYQDAKTDRAFYGWPSYWNILFFYLWGFGAEPVLTFVLVGICGVGTFLPIPFPYPSKHSLQRHILGPMIAGWCVGVGYVLYWSTPPVAVLALTALAPAYYMVLPAFYYDELRSEDRGDE